MIKMFKVEVWADHKVKGEVNGMNEMDIGRTTHIFQGVLKALALPSLSLHCLLVVLLPLLLLAGCREYEVPSTYELVVTVSYPDEFDQGGPVAGAEVKVTNIQTGRVHLGVTGQDGKAVLTVRGGNYNIVVSLTEEREVEIEGYPVVKQVLFNGALNGQLVTVTGTACALELGYSFENEGFVIKELYTSGSKTPEGKAYGADKFIEIYNNSDKVLYSDGLCIGVVHSTTTYQPTPWVNPDGSLMDRIPLWSFVAIVPGSGTEHPIAPGTSFVVALSGLNHRDDPNGNPNSIDLSHAAWEFYVEDGMYVDVPGVPNILMQMITKSTAMVFDVRGQVTILFRLPEGELEDIFTDPDNYMVQPGGTFRCFMVPWGWVIDGVENARLDDRGVYKRLPSMIDIGYIQHRGSSEKVSIRRKILKTVDGRVVYKDTNNSTEDFLTDQDPAPGVIK